MHFCMFVLEIFLFIVLPDIVVLHDIFVGSLKALFGFLFVPEWDGEAGIARADERARKDDAVVDTQTDASRKTIN